MPFEPGKILLLAFPFSDGTSTKLRPVVVVSNRAASSHGDFVVVPISSRVDPACKCECVIMDSHEAFDETRLNRSSTIKWTKPMTVNKKVVQKQLGVLPHKLIKEIRESLSGMFR